MSTDRRTRAWVEVDASALRRNARRLVEAVGPATPLIPMVKADAYGLGLARVVEALVPLAPAAWGVATVDEGKAVRMLDPRRPVHVYSPLPPRELARAVAAGLTPTLSSADEVAVVAEAARGLGGSPAPFQVEVDTGMGRSGAVPADIERWRGVLRALPGEVQWVGLFTHFHSADEPGGPGMVQQLERFEAVLDRFAPPPGVRIHVANSAAAVRGGLAPHLTGAVRGGIFVYGGGSAPELPAPEPVVALRARVARVAEVQAGATCGYGATWRAGGPERWATLGIGYGDGLRRDLVPGAHVLVQGRRVPLVGRVSMDVVVANISGLDGVRPGHVATLLGSDGAERITVDEMAAWAGTIPYEILTGLGPRLPRIWNEVDDGDDG